MTACPNCQVQSSSLALRCSACGSTLQHAAEHDSATYRRAAFWVDARMLSGIGTVLGLGLAWLLRQLIMSGMGIYLDQRQRFLLGVGVTLAGALCGFAMAARKYGKDAQPLRREKPAVAKPALKNPWERDR
ncbi:hypothetical protein [Achromobacter dolens]|uniref:hypothetical protein n=1 Tax=Achromobacter dolens TaxID=1287738 RepID=UPI001583CCBB|nr:hypothetical protein [Achromobacter dolens]